MCLVNTKFLSDLLKMAHIYQLKDLQDDCEEYLQRNVTKENAVEAWTAAGVSGSQKLRDKALKTIARVILYVNFCLQYSKAMAICQEKSAGPEPLPLRMNKAMFLRSLFTLMQFYKFSIKCRDLLIC